MRGFVIFAFLIVGATGLGNTLDPQGLDVTGAIVLMGTALVAVLAAIAMGLYDLVNAFTQKEKDRA